MSDEKNEQGGEEFAAMLAASGSQATQRPAVGESVRGRVIALGGGSAFIEIGGKVEAVIDLGEFVDPETNTPTLAVGDQIEATVVDDGRTSGTVRLKRTVGRGGHVRVGIEDYGGPRRPRNDELVAEVAAIAHDAGRRPATPAEAAAIIGLGS